LKLECHHTLAGEVQFLFWDHVFLFFCSMMVLKLI
jgi:hypothetical protein